MCEWDAAPLPGQGRRKTLQRRRPAVSMATISVDSHTVATEMCEWDAAPLPGQGRRKALQRRRFAISTATISVSSHAAAVSGHLFAVKAGFLRAMLPARKTGRARAKLCRRRAKISPVLLHLRKRRLFQNMQAQRVLPRLRFPCGSGGYCATRRTAGRGSSSAFPAEAAVTARDGQRVAVLRPLSLRKRRSLRSAMDRGAVLRPLSLRKRRLLCSATDSGSRLFVRPPCGSGVCCAARRTAGRGSSSAFSAEVAVTARPAPAPRRRPPRWRAWPEGSCPSAHPASSRASPRPSRGPRANIRRRTSCPCTSSSGS